MCCLVSMQCQRFVPFSKSLCVSGSSVKDLFKGLVQLLHINIKQLFGDVIFLSEDIDKELKLLQESFTEFGIQLNYEMVNMYTSKQTGTCKLKDHKVVIRLSQDRLLVVGFDYLLYSQEPMHLE